MYLEAKEWEQVGGALATLRGAVVMVMLRCPACLVFCTAPRTFHHRPSPLLCGGSVRVPSSLERFRDTL